MRLPIQIIQVMFYVAMPYVIYFKATTVAPSAFRSAQYQATQYFNQLTKYIMLTIVTIYQNSYLAVILI